MQALTAHSGGRERNAAVLPLPAFTDNYIWAIVRDGQAAVVDPGEAGPVLRLLEQQGLRLRAILLTHHHGDHVGGVSELSRIEALPYTVRRANGCRAATFRWPRETACRSPNWTWTCACWTCPATPPATSPTPAAPPA